MGRQLGARQDSGWFLGLALAALLAPACEHAGGAAAPAPALNAPAQSREPSPRCRGRRPKPAPVAETPVAPAPAQIAREPVPAMPHYTVMSAPVAGSSSSVAAVPLKPGAVEMIQQRLESVGALSLQQSTGEMGAATRAALARFQEANHLPITGEPDEATIRMLHLDPKNIFETPLGGAE